MIRAWTENRILREPVAEFCVSHETVWLLLRSHAPASDGRSDPGRVRPDGSLGRLDVNERESGMLKENNQ
jgi:hypothetical protein